MPCAHSNKRHCLSNLLAPFLVLCVCSIHTAGDARDYKVGAGLDVGYEWYERTYEVDSSADQDSENGIVTTTEDLTNSLDDTYNRIRISPQIIIESQTARDKVDIKYSPSFRYDTDTYEHDIDHYLVASLTRLITEAWRLNVDERFVLSDIVENEDGNDTTTESQLSDSDGRRLYMTNDISVATSYTYWEDSEVSLGYTYSILEDVDDDDGSNAYENYDRHSFTLSAGHRFNSSYNLLFSSGYVRGLYDEAQVQTELDENFTESDLEEFRIATILETNLIEYHPLSLAYSYYGVDFDDVDRKSNSINNLTLGWEWLYSKDFTVSLGGGPSYIKTDGQDGEWGYNGNWSLKYDFEDGSVGLTGQSGYERENFTGTDRNGLQEFWQAGFNFNYRVLEDVTFSMYSSYRYEDEEQISGSTAPLDEESDPEFEISNYNKEVTRAGATVRYLFERYYSLSLSYNFTYQESERENDTYDEHRLVLILGFQRDLFKW